MYISSLISIGRTEDSKFVIEISVHTKKSKNSENEVISVNNPGDKTIVENDYNSAITSLKLLLKDLPKNGYEIDEYNKVFKEITKGN